MYQRATVLGNLKSNVTPTVNDPRFLAYLTQNLGLSEAALAIVSRQRQPTVTELPIVLWNYGLISLEQLGSIFDWMEGTAA